MKNIIFAILLLTGCAMEGVGSEPGSITTRTRIQGTETITETVTEYVTVTETSVSTETKSSTPTATATQTKVDTSTYTYADVVVSTATNTQNGTSTYTEVKTTPTTKTATTTATSIQTSIATYTVVDARTLTKTSTETVTTTAINGQVNYCALPMSASLSSDSELTCTIGQDSLTGKPLTQCSNLFPVVQQKCSDVLPVSGELAEHSTDSKTGKDILTVRYFTTCADFATLGGCQAVITAPCGFCAKTCNRC